MMELLKKEVFEANLMLPKYELVTFTWGNVSAIDRSSGLVVIKPSGICYEEMSLEQMVIVDLDGHIIEGSLNPSSDLSTHLVLYKEFPDIGGIVHTHSRWATIFAQCGLGIPAFGTTHADDFYGEVPCTHPMTNIEIESNYERETGNVIVRHFRESHISPNMIPAVLVHGHGPFTWGKDAGQAVHNAVVLEEAAMMAWHCKVLAKDALMPISQALLDKHYLRKHGMNAYYGQKS